MGEGGDHSICNKSMPSIIYTSAFYSKQKKIHAVGEKKKKVVSLLQLNLKLDSKIILVNFRL